MDVIDRSGGGSGSRQKLMVDPQTNCDARVIGRSGGRIRVLLADDHEIVRQGLTNLLGFEPDLEVVGEAGNGRQAVDLVRQLKPAVVLMDVTMPEMNGIEATHLLLSEMPEVRVIGLSMHTHEEMAALMRAAGAVRYLAKGGQIEDLIKAIREVCPRQDNDLPGGRNASGR